VKWKILHGFCWKFNSLPNDAKIIKLGSHLTTLSPIMYCPVFMDHSVRISLFILLTLPKSVLPGASILHRVLIHTGWSGKQATFLLVNCTGCPGKKQALSVKQNGVFVVQVLKVKYSMLLYPVVECCVMLIVVACSRNYYVNIN